MLVVPFSLDSIFKSCDFNLDMRFVLILNYKHVRTAGLTVHNDWPKESIRIKAIVIIKNYCLFYSPFYDGSALYPGLCTKDNIVLQLQYNS